jgi:hypothetical protein
MARTQMRLDAITGSLVADDSTGAVNEESLQGVLDRMVGSLERHHGGEWYSQPAGVFTQPVQIRDNLNVTGSADIDGNLNVDGGAVIDLTLAVAGAADLQSELDVGAAARFASTLAVAGAADLNGALDVAGRVDLGDNSGTADTFVRGDLSVAQDASVTGDLTVSGDLTVLGDTVQVNVGELLVEDNIIQVNKNGTAMTAQTAGLEIYRGSGVDLATFTWSESDEWFELKAGTQYRKAKMATARLDGVKGAFFLSSSADGDIVAGTAADLVGNIGAQFAGTNIAVSEAGGVITYALTAGTGVTMDGSGGIAIGQPVATTDNVTFADLSADSAKLADHSADAGKAYKVGTDGAIEPAAWNEFVSVEGNVGLELVQDSFKAQIGLAQDIRTSASPEFAALNIGSDHDMLADGANLKLLTAGEIKLEGADGAYMLAEAGDRAAFTGSFGASETIIGAINSLAATSATFYKHQEILSADMAAGAKTIAFLDTTITNAEKRIDVYVNGQLLSKGASADYDYVNVVNAGDEAKIDFKFDLKADDAIVVISR